MLREHFSEFLRVCLILCTLRVCLILCTRVPKASEHLKRILKGLRGCGESLDLARAGGSRRFRERSFGEQFVAEGGACGCYMNVLCSMRLRAAVWPLGETVDLGPGEGWARGGRGLGRH